MTYAHALLGPPNMPLVSTADLASVGPTLGSYASFNDSFFPTANKGFYIPVSVRAPFVIRKLFIYNGNAVAGNVDVGVYDLTNAKVIASGITAQAGVSQLQEFDVTDTPISPGTYYLALSASSGSAVFLNWNTDTQFLKSTGILSELSAHALPATMTPVPTTSNFAPLIGMASRTLVA